MLRVPTCFAILVFLSLPALAQQSVTVGGKQATLHVPANARASAILIPGKGGVDPSDPLLRNRAAINARGIATLVVPHGTIIGEAIQYMRKVKEPVALVGRSAGVSFAGGAIGNGSKPDSLVLISVDAAGQVARPGLDQDAGRHAAHARPS